MQPTMKDLMRLVENAAVGPVIEADDAVDESLLPLWRLVSPTQGLGIPLRFHHAATPDEAAEVFASRVGPKQWRRVKPNVASLKQVRAAGKMFKYEVVFTSVDPYDGTPMERMVEILIVDATSDFED